MTTRLDTATDRAPHIVTRFVLPEALAARAPIEATGGQPDDVRLLVVGPDTTSDRAFRDLPQVLAPGDLVVVNTSAALPSALPGRRGDGRPTIVHLAGPAGPGARPGRSHLGERWLVELRRPDRRGPQLDGRPGETLTTVSGARISLVEPRSPGSQRLWQADVAVDGDVAVHLRRHGRPIAYGYLDALPDRSTLRTVFGVHPGSAEVPSASRPFRHRTVTALVTRGVAVAPVTLHTSVSSPDAGEPPLPERFAVPAATASLVAHTRRQGGRVVAVGTTVARALESAADGSGLPRAASGWTDLVLSAARPARVVDGLLTGWHAPEASHLALLESVAGPATVARAYAAGLAHEHRWHEFGDTCLLLPGPRSDP